MSDVQQLRDLQDKLEEELRPVLGPAFLSRENRVLLRKYQLSRVGNIGSEPKVSLLLFQDLILLTKEEQKSYKLQAKVFHHTNLNAFA